MATTYASSYNINFRGCSKFVSGPVFLSRKCAKACNRINFSALQKFFSGQLHVNWLTSQFSRVAPPPAPGHTFEPAWPHKSLENFQGPGKFFHRPAPGHMSHKRLNPPGPTKARRPFFIFFRGPESFSTTLRRSHVRTRLVPQKPRKPSGAGKVFPPPPPGPTKAQGTFGARQTMIERGEVINSEFRFSEARYTI